MVLGGISHNRDDYLEILSCKRANGGNAYACPFVLVCQPAVVSDADLYVALASYRVSSYCLWRNAQKIDANKNYHTYSNHHASTTTREPLTSKTFVNRPNPLTPNQSATTITNT